MLYLISPIMAAMINLSIMPKLGDPLGEWLGIIVVGCVAAVVLIAAMLALGVIKRHRKVKNNTEDLL